MTAAYLFYAPRFRPLSPSGEILPGAYIQFYATGTATPTDVYADAGLTTPLSNPVVADSAGEFVPIYLDPTVTYRAQLYDADDVLQWDEDPLAPPRDFMPGTVMWFHGTEEERDTAYPPALWQVLDGNNGTPDGRDRFPVIAGGDYESGDTGGSGAAATTSAAGGHDHGGETGGHQLTVSEMPEHFHGLWGDTNTVDTATHGLGANVTRSIAGRSAAVANSYIDESGATSEQLVESTGGDGEHDHTITAADDHTHTVTVTPPYVALWALMRRAS